MEWLEQLKNARFHGVKELADAAEELLREIGPSQDRGTVAEYPNERTIRYYLSENLLPDSLGRAGSASIFGYEHLVTLAAIKKLQSQGLPINVIKGVIDGRSIEQLATLLGEEVTVFTDEQELADYRRETGHTDDSDVMVLNDPNAREDYLQSKAAPPPNAAKSFLESLLFSRSVAPPSEKLDLSVRPTVKPQPSPIVHSEIQPPADIDSKKWDRYEVEPGLELHVREDYAPAVGWRKAIKTIEKILRRASGK